MPPAPMPARRAHVIYLSRAVFGIGFLVLGGLVLARVLAAAAPAGSKVVGAALGVVMVTLGCVRIGQYLRLRRDAG